MEIPPDNPLKPYYVECKMGCGHLIGKGTPSHTCWQCRMTHAIDPIPALPQFRRAHWKKVRDDALQRRFNYNAMKQRHT
jgi:hypothetical protein